MMKTAVLTPESGASPGIPADSFSSILPAVPPDPAHSSPPCTLLSSAPGPTPYPPVLPKSSSASMPIPPSPSALHSPTSPLSPPPPSPSALHSSTSPLSPPPPSPKPPTPLSPSPPITLVDISVPNKPKPSSQPPPTPPPHPNSKLSSPPLPRPLAPKVPKPSCPPLPMHLSSAVPKPASQPRAPPPPLSKPSSPPLPRSTFPSVSKASAGPLPAPPASHASKPALPSISILEKLIKTCPVWLQLGMAQERATLVLNKESQGIFLVRRDSSLKTMVLAVRRSGQQGEPQIQELPVKEEKSLMYLEGSVLVFDNIFKLVAFYCVSRDILPFTLRLPQVIVQATKYEDMEVISTLGLEFWGSSLNSRSEEVGRGCAGGGQGAQGRSSCEIELSAGNDRLWYVNPIFIEEYCNSLPSPSPAPILRSQSLNTPMQVPPKYKRPPPLPPRPPNVPEGLLLPAVTGAKPERREEGVSEAPAPSSPGSPPPTGRVAQKEEGSPRECEGGERAPALGAEREPPSGPGVTAQPPQPAQSEAGKQPQPSQNEAGKQPQPAQSVAGKQPQPSQNEAGKQPQPAQNEAGKQPQPSQNEAGKQPQPSQNEAGKQPQPSQNEAGKQPQPSQNEAGKQPQPSQSEAGKQPRRIPSHRVPPVPVRRRLSEKQPSEEPAPQEGPSPSTNASGQAEKREGDPSSSVPVALLICLDDSSMAEVENPEDPHAVEPEALREEGPAELSEAPGTVAAPPAVPVKKAAPPVPPPRRKRLSQALLSPETPEFTSLPLQTSGMSMPTCRSLSVPACDAKGSDVSLYSPEGGVPQPDHDSYSTSSTEEEADTVPTSAMVKRTPTIMLDRAKQRLSMVNLSNVFTGFMSADRKLQKRIVELSRDGSSYFGNLVRDYRAFTLETMRRHSSSTEMLQEIRQMMTQLKSYLIQSAELQSLHETAVYTEDKLEVIIEAALCKSVLKPLREAVYAGLKDIHARAGTLKKLRENQQVVLGTTTTDLGVTTSVPETPVMDRLQQKLGTLHQEYSPQRKIDLLLKTCKIIYEAMSVGSPGRPHGADDFLPVLMYVLARSNMSALLLDVEYMMELMDPALQLGEGSYYLTTTYGALEHIKNFDKQAMTRQLSLEIQDSIHRWERRRTLNKARVSRSSVQDFINVSFLEAGSNTKTLGVRPTTSAQDLCDQCADKYEVLEPESYCLSVLVEGHYRALAPEELPLTIKSSLHHSEPRQEYYFVYRPGHWTGGQEAECPTSPTTTAPEDNLIVI